MTQSKSLLAVKKKHFDLTKSFHRNFEKVIDLQRQAIQEILPALTLELDLQEEGRNRARAFLDDPGTIFRFYRRARYNSDAALSTLTSTLLWRLRTDLDLLSLSSLHPLYVSPPSDENPPLFWLNSEFKDRFNRPCGLISLRSLERTQERTLDEVKEYIVASMEITRRYLASQFSKFLNHKLQSNSDLDMEFNQDEYFPDDEEDSKWIEASAPIQMVIAFDLAGSGMANLELELLPFLLDLLKNHFPGMVGAVYILNYGWVHSGMWAVAKRVLPEQALARIFFPNDSELKQHFKAENLPIVLGGDNPVEIEAESADVSKKFGRRRRFFNGNLNQNHSRSNDQTPMGSPTLEKKSLSRNPSYENIYDVFYSAAGTPWASRPASPRGSGRSTPGRGNESPASSTFPLPHSNNELQMTPSAARKLRNLQMTRGSGELSLTAEMIDRSPLHSPRRSRANSAADIKGNQQPPTFQSIYNSNQNRHVRFTGSNSNVDVIPTPSPFSPSDSNGNNTPNRRIGNVRDFRLHLPQSENHEFEILNMEESSDSDTASDQSGKVGEKRVSPVDEREGHLLRTTSTSGGDDDSSDLHAPDPPGLFARLRRASRNSFGAMTEGIRNSISNPSSNDGLNGNGRRDSSLPSRDEEEKSYRIKLRDQQALQSNNALNSKNQIDGQGQDQEEEDNRSSSSTIQESSNMDINNDKDSNINSNDLPSPELQVPLMEEEPLAGNQVSSPTVHFFSQRSKKYNGPGIVSPYNSGNPFWGYPAIVPRNSNLNSISATGSRVVGGEMNSGSLGLSTGPSQSSSSSFNPYHDQNQNLNFNHYHQFQSQSISSSTPRQLHSRRRKRDLIRTLSYLFVLRFLAFHRHLRWKVILIWKEIFKTLKIGGIQSEDGSSSNHSSFVANVGAAAENDHRWKALEERHRLNRLKSRSQSSAARRNGGNFDLAPKGGSMKSRKNDTGKNRLKFFSFWKTWLTLFLICMMLRPKSRKSLSLTLIAFIQGVGGNGKGGVSKSLSSKSTSMRSSLTGLHVRERLLGI